MELKNREGEIFWGIVEELEKKGHSETLAIKAAHVLTDRKMVRERHPHACPVCGGTGKV